MDNVLYKGLSTYYDTLFKSGYLPFTAVKNLIILDYLTDLLNDPDFYIVANPCEQGIANRLYKCLIQNNCLI